MDDVDSRRRHYAAPRATCHGDSAAVAPSLMGTGGRNRETLNVIFVGVDAHNATHTI
jgi:hypothetical protein